MVNKRFSSRTAPKSASTPALAASSTSLQHGKSSLLKTSFCPSVFQLALFASVIQLLDTQQLRIHDIDTGRPKCVYTPPRTQINCITWGLSGRSTRLSDSQPLQKKRRRQANGDNPGQDAAAAVVAIGTQHESIELFSPLESKVVTTLAPAHSHGTRDVKFRGHDEILEAWSLGADSTLIQWNLHSKERARSIAAPVESIFTITLLQNHVLAASHAACLLDYESLQIVQKFPGFKTPIHALIAPVHGKKSNSITVFLAAANTSRYINAYEMGNGALLGSLIVDHDVQKVHLQEDEINNSARGQNPLAVVAVDGRVDIFTNAFDWKDSRPGSKTLKDRSKSFTRKPQATLQITRSVNDATSVPILDVSFQQSDLVMALAEGSANISFERIPFQDEQGHLLVSGLVQRVKTKSISYSGEQTNGVKDLDHTQVNEAHTVVAQGADLEVGEAPDTPHQEIIEISSANESDSDDSGAEAEQAEGKPLTNGIAKSTADMEDVSEESNIRHDKDENNELTFGDMIRAKSGETVDVTAIANEGKGQALVSANEKAYPPTNLSLGTVLTQSLRTNDGGLLETCLQVQDLQIVRATIERLGPDLATTLLQRLAERLHTRPGRAGSLLVWVQWTLVAHGGYLASRPDIVKRLTSLHNVVRERAKGLQPLLSLKGKLDMLEAQVNLRKSRQENSSTKRGPEKIQAPVIYVEGQEESSSDSDDENQAITSLEQSQDSSDEIDDESASESDKGDAHDTMDLDDDDDSELESDEEGLIDDEASESGTSVDDQMMDDVDYDDVDSIEEAGAEPESEPQQSSKESPRGKR